jgi:hypothetical protein
MSEEFHTPGVETPAVPVAPAPGTPAYNAQLAAEGNAATGNIPEKFQRETPEATIAAMAAGYAELEKNFHGQGTAPAPQAVAEPVVEVPVEASVQELRVPDAPPVEEAPVEEPGSKTVVKDSEMAHYTQEIMRSGNISEESKASLVERGIPESLIDSMVEGQRAKMRDQYSRAGDIVGGSDRLSKIFGWAAKNLDEGQRAAINAGLAGSASEATLRGMASMYDASGTTAQAKAAEPREAPRYAGNPAGRQVQTGFASKAEYYAATSDAAKMADPHFRGAVEQRMILTDWTTLG